MLLDKAIANFNNFLMVGRSKATYDYYQFYLERIKKHFKKVNIDVISRWITQKIISIMGIEDEILINMIMNIFEPRSCTKGLCKTSHC